MIKNIISESAFDASKSPSKPKAASNEATSNGATFQSYYSASETQQNSDRSQSAVREVAQFDTIVTDDEALSTLSVDVADPPKSDVSAIDQEFAASEDDEPVVPTSTSVEVLPAEKSSMNAVSVSQGAQGESEVVTSSAANVNGNVTTAQENSGLNQVARQPVHRGIAELRMTGPQPGTVAERQPMQTTVAGQSGPMVEKTPGSSPQETPPIATGATNAGLKAETIGTAVKAGQTTPEVQAAQQTTTTNTPRRAKVSQPGIAANTQGNAGVATHQAAGQSMPDGLQSVMKPLPEEQAAPLREAASEEVEVKTNIRPIRKATGPVSNTTVQVQQVSQSAAISQVSVVNAEALTDPLSVNLALDSSVFEPAGLSQLLTEAVMSPGTTHRPETPRLVAVQLAEALAAKGERNIDVALSPEELGRVKMRVSTTESSVVVTITTERPETGDLMRRHIDELSEEFRRMGFEDISFEFGGEGMPGDGSEQRDSLDSGSSGASDGSPIADNVQEAAQQNLRLGESGLDMRI